ncbi:MAG: MASE3 domain-containing protein, partial [Methanosarcinaceae archaeon]|nr:MASE3 domain-containing protein [Methanosarcinaceae archaeon]
MKQKILKGDYIGGKNRISISYKEILFLVLVLTGLYITSLSSYLLFHSLVEIFSITVAICIFMMAWNSRYKIENNYLLFTGISFVFIAAIDLLHTLAYKGMGVFTGFDANLPTQLWIAARYLQSISLLIAPLFFYRKLKQHNLNINFVIIIYSIVLSLLIASIFYWKVFPDCFIEGKGLTTFKIVSEYVISFIMAASIYLLYKNKKEFDTNVFSLIVTSIIILIFSEMAFTTYASVFGFANMLGHLFKFVAFYLIYKAIIVMGFMKPYDLIFRNIKKSEDELTEHRDRLAELVDERTAELALANQKLNSELIVRRKTEEELQKYRDHLEELVKERTDEIQTNKQALVNIVEDLNTTAEELKNANERLLELDLLKSMFIASTSHELRTPLNSIIGFTSVLLEGWSGELNTEQQEQLGIVLTSGKYLLNLINDVIDISKIEAGKIEIYTEQFNLGDVVNEAVSLIKTDVEQKGLTITADVPDITIDTDRRRLLQCIINLLSNAMKFTEKGSITIKAKTINNVVDISISDTGIGIKEEDLTKLFKAFVRLES